MGLLTVVSDTDSLEGQWTARILTKANCIKRVEVRHSHHGTNILIVVYPTHVTYGQNSTLEFYNGTDYLLREIPLVVEEAKELLASSLAVKY